MAISLAFGVLVAAFITLFVVPSGYLILEDLRRLPERLTQRVPRARSSVEVPVSTGFFARLRGQKTVRGR
jgi:hypothetical protein